MSVVAWHPSPASIFKLKFDAAIFSDLNSAGFDAMILNEKGEVMAAMLATAYGSTCGR